jgi:hypothetical protein
MKKLNQISKVVILGLLSSNMAFAANSPFSEGVGAAQGPVPSVVKSESPFSEGTGRLRLSPEERQTLLQYADNAYSLIRSALEEANGRDFKEANQIYSEVIQKIVVQSFAQKARQELLMRFVLNQALELTVGLPNAGGQSFGGLLAGSVNEELMTIVLEDSMRLAMQLYSDDRRAIEAGSTTLQPVMETAIARLSLAQKWGSSIIEQEVSFDFQKMALQHFLNTAVNANNLLKNTFAEEIVKADDILNKVEGQTGSNMALLQVMRGVRTLRKDISVIVRDANYKNASLSTELRPRKLSIK